MQLYRLLVISALLLLAICISIQGSSAVVEVDEQDIQAIAAEENEEEQYIEQGESSRRRSPFDDMFGNVLYGWSKETPDQAEQHWTGDLLAVKTVHHNI